MAGLLLEHQLSPPFWCEDNNVMNFSTDRHPEWPIPRRLEVEAASGIRFIFHVFSIRNSGASADDVRKIACSAGKAGV